MGHNGQFSIAVLVYQRVRLWGWPALVLHSQVRLGKTEGITMDLVAHKWGIIQWYLIFLRSITGIDSEVKVAISHRGRVEDLVIIFDREICVFVVVFFPYRRG